MIKNFKKTLPNFIYNLQYEKFVSDPENEAKKLMKFCGLPWDIKCLEFYKRRDLISKTTSNVQIRKAIYKDSINKYLPYKQFLSKYGNKYSWFNLTKTPVKPKNFYNFFARPYSSFFLFLFSFFSLIESLAFFIVLESFNDFPLYLFDIIFFLLSISLHAHTLFLRDFHIQDLP